MSMPSCSSAPATGVIMSERRCDHRRSGQCQSDDDALQGDGASSLRDPDGIGDGLQPISQHDDVGGLGGRGCAPRAHRYAYSCRRQCRRIVDAVADHHRRRPGFFGFHRRNFFSGARIGNDVVEMTGGDRALQPCSVVARQHHEPRHSDRAKFVKRVRASARNASPKVNMAAIRPSSATNTRSTGCPR